MHFHPAATGTGLVVTQLAQDLAELGDDVTVITSMPHYGKRELPSEYRHRLLHRSDFNGVRLWRTFVYVPPNPRVFHRAINYLTYTLMSVLAGIASGRQDVLLAINPPITVGLSGWVVARLKRTPMVFNLQDVWPESVVAVNQLRNPWAIRTSEYLERLIYRASDKVTVLSDGMRRNLLDKGVDEGKLAIIPNWADVEGIQPVAKDNSFRRTHNPDGHFTAMFAGNIGYIAVLDTVLEAAEILREDGRFTFLIVGEGNDKVRLIEKADALGLANVRFLPTQPREILSEMLGAADASLVTLKEGLGGTNVPSKSYSIMASARPIVASVPEDSEVARMVKEGECGVWVPPENPQALASVLREIAAQPDLLRQYGDNGRRYVVENFSRETLTRRYHDLLSNLVDSA